MSSFEMELGTNSYFAFIEYTGFRQPSFSLRLSDNTAGARDKITLKSLAVNNRPLDLPEAEISPTSPMKIMMAPSPPDPTIYGSNGGDDITGGDSDDIINGGDGDDVLYGGSGNDTLYGGNDNDILYGDGLTIANVMEAGRTSVMQTDSSQWHTVTFSEAITDPVIKMFADDIGNAPFTIRVRNITDTGFEFQLDEFDYQDGITSLEDISWLAVASGTHTLENGQVIQAGFVDAIDQSTSNVAFNTSMTSPVVFSQVSSDNELSAVVTRNSAVSSNGFSVKMQEEENANGTHLTESIGWIAIESGGSALEGLLSGITGDNVTHSTSIINFGGTFAATSIFLADMQVLDGADTAYVASASAATTTQAQIYIDEETSADTETNHTDEIVGYLALLEGAYTAETQINGSDGIYGGNGDDIIYADLSEDLDIGIGQEANPLTAQILQNTPVAYWNLNEDTGTAFDNLGVAGSSVDGSLIGGANLGADALYEGGGSSVEFDGVSGGIHIPDNDGINTSTYTEKTVELVFNADDVTTRQVLYEEGGSIHGLSIYLDNGNVYVTGENDGVWVDADIHAAVTTGTTYHIAFVFDQSANSFEGFLNGVSIGSVTVGNATFPSHSGDIGIGYAPDSLQFHDGESTTGGFHFDGRISDVAIYTAALTAADLQAHAEIVLGNLPAPLEIDDILYGGDGFDQLYGGNGRDVFVFEADSAFNDIDEVNGFDVREQDALDISDILTGYVAGSSDIHNFVQITDSAGNSIISVDANGSVGGANFVDIAQINGVTDLDLDSMLANYSIIPV